ncbi:PASTA domain-containing protein, partial [Streptomyces kasugaensis]
WRRRMSRWCAPATASMPMAPVPPARKNNTPVIVVSAVVGVVVVTAIAIGIGLSGGSDNNKAGDKPTSTYTPYTYSPAPTASVRPEDKTATILSTECTSPAKSYSDKNKILFPSFRFKNLDSVKACLDAAGWKYKVTEQDSAIWGKNTVTEQTPAAISWWAPSNTETIQLTVSTGRSG